MKDYLKYFPFDSPRKEQEEIIDKTLDAISKGKKFILIEAPTGVGKSAISINLGHYGASLGKHSYILTTQKILQDQYVQDFKNIASIKGKDNYTCQFYNELSCVDSSALLSKDSEEQSQSAHYNTCGNGNCFYRAKKQAFLESYVGMTNLSYFLHETTYAKESEPRELLIIDECHNLEKELMSFVNVSLSSFYVKKNFGLELPNFSTKSPYVSWMKEDLLPQMIKRFNDLKRIIMYHKRKNDTEKTISIGKDIQSLDRKIKSTTMFLSKWDSINWALNKEKDGPGGIKISFKPINVSEFAKEHVFNFGNTNIMMSATILNKTVFCKSLGIPEDECEFVSVGSPFDKDNRPIHYMPVGNMNNKLKKFTLPKIALAIKEILDSHKDEKGIIHTNSYENARYIYNSLKNPRLLVHTTKNRDKVLEKHINSKEPTVIVTPSMTEGVDLKYELSRFQILCKVPYPYLLDKQIQLKMKMQPWWYNYETAKIVIQALGRSIRTEDDHAVSYILDSSWAWFYKNNIRLFPEWFREAYK